MAASTCRTHDHEGVLGDLLVRDSLVARDRVVLRVETQSRDANAQHRICTTRITVVRTHGGVVPRCALDKSIELPKILQLFDLLSRHPAVLENLCLVKFEEGSHVIAHGFAVYLRAYPRPFEVEGADFEFPWIAHDDCSRQQAVAAFFAEVLNRMIRRSL